MFLTLATILSLTLVTFGQNSNSSSNKRGNKRKARPTAKQPKLDLTALDYSALMWAEVGKTNDSIVSYNIMTVKRVTRNVVRAWTKTELKDESAQTKSDFLRNRRAQSLPISGYEDYSHSLELNEYNCTTGQGRVLARIDYDTNGNVIDSVQYRNPSWTYVVPDSIGYSLSRRLCKF